MNKVFEKIIEKLEEYEYENLVEHDSEQSQHCKDAGDCEMRDCTLCIFDKAIEIVKQEAEKYNNGWIPCSERLPEEMELVLIYAESTARGGSIRVVAQLYNGFWFAQTSSETLGLTGIGQYNVIAWQQLPHPYQLKGEGEGRN